MTSESRRRSFAPWLVVAALFFYLGSSHKSVQNNHHVQQLATFLHKVEQPAFHLLIAQSHRTDALCAQLRLFAQYAYPEPTIIMYSGLAPDWVEANKQKIPSTLAYLEKFTKPNDIVMFLDGGDVHPNNYFKEMLATFHKLDQDWTLGAERICWPLESAKFCTDIPDSPLEGQEMHGELSGQIARKMAKHVSGGHSIGRAGTILRAHRRMMRELEIPRWPDLAIDQILLQYFQWEGLSGMTPDYYNDFFLAMNNMTPDDYTIENIPGSPRSAIRSNWSGRRPHTVHYNGQPMKRMMENSTLFHADSLAGWPAVPPSVRFDDGSRQLLTDFCPTPPLVVQ